MPSLITQLAQDIRYATRQLRRAPAFAVIVLVTLMLAIGATAALVSVLRATLLNPTPYPGAAQIVTIQDVNRKGIATNGLVAVPRAHDLAEATATLRSGRASATLFDSVAFFFFDQPALKIGSAAPLSVSSVGTSGDFFKVLKTPPLLGRTFTAQDNANATNEVAVISYGLWQRAFAADPAVIGRAVVLGGKATTIIGVMPRFFDYPAKTDLWQPTHLSYQNFAGYRGAGSRFVVVIGRLNPAFTLATAQSAVNVLATRLASAYPATDADWGFHLTSLRSEILGTYREGLLLITSAVALLLLIAAANIAGLMLARNVRRQPEIALRRALGITDARLLRQLLTESLLLVLAGSALGVALAFALLPVLVAVLPAAVVSFETPHLDLATLATTIVVAFVVAVLCGIAPAVQAKRISALEALGNSQSRTVAQGTRRFGRIFATVQIALALVLLTLASTLVRSLHTLLQARLGFEPTHVLVTSVHVPFGSDAAKTHRLYQQLEQRFATLPGVQSVGAIDAPPVSGNYSFPFAADILGQRPTPHHDAVTAEARTITPTYLQTLGIPLLAGRPFTDRDSAANSPAVVLVNQSFAARYFPQQSAIGHRLISVNYTAEIVGITGDVRGTSGDLGAAPGPEIYQLERGFWPDMHFVLRTALPASSLEPALRAQLAAIDPTFALGSVSLLASSIDDALQQPRLNTGLLAALAGLALLLVLVGVYGIVAFSAGQRTREIGLRIALGSTRIAVVRMLLLESLSILLAGTVIGTGVTLLSTRVLAAQVSGLNAPITDSLLITAGLLTLAVLAASFFPARRAAWIDPVEALRSE